MPDDLDSILEQATTVIPTYEDLTRGNYLAKIPVLRNNRGAPVIRNLSIEGKTDHGEAMREVLTFDNIDAKVRAAFEAGDFRFNLANGFHGDGFRNLDEGTQSFLKTWEMEYLPKYREFRQQLDEHDEIKNYRHVMVGALGGVAAGAVVGIGIDALACMTDTRGVYVEISARSLPAIFEAYGIARPFLKRPLELIAYRRGRTQDRPKPFTPTEIWSLTGLAGPLIGFGMLIIGEETGLNKNILYRSAAVTTVNMGNNAIGSAFSYMHFFREIRKVRIEHDERYRHFRFEKETYYGNILSHLYNLKQIAHSRQKLKDLRDDFYLAGCNFWADKFQSSNVIIVGSGLALEIGLRYLGVAAEEINFSGCFGGRSLAAIESGLLSCDTAAAAKVAIERGKKQLHADVRKLTDKAYLAQLYAA